MQFELPFIVFANYPFKDLDGSFLGSLRGRGLWTNDKGVAIEDNVVLKPVLGRADTGRETAQRYAITYEQTCVLYVASTREGELIYQDGRSEPVGRWQEVSPQTAAKLPAYTEIGGRFFACMFKR